MRAGRPGRSRVLCAALAAGWALAATTPAAADLVVGPQTRITDTGRFPGSESSFPAHVGAAYNPERDEHVIAWDVTWGPDEEHPTSVNVRTVGPDGTPRGPKHQLGRVRWSMPRIAHNPVTGGYLVAWSDPEGHVYAHRLAADGSPVGGRIALGPDEPLDDDNIALAVNGAGDYVVAWSGEVPVPDPHDPGEYRDDAEVVAQRVSGTGQLAGPRHQVSMAGEGDDAWYYTSRSPVLAYDTLREEFLIGWVARPPGTTTSELYSRRLTADGTPVPGPPVTLSDAAGAVLAAGWGGYGVGRAELAFSPRTGEFLAVWTGSQAQLTSAGIDVFARRVTPAGLPDGPVTMVNDDGPGAAYGADLGVQPGLVHDGGAGEFVALWRSSFGGFTPVVRGQRLDEDDPAAKRPDVTLSEPRADRLGASMAPVVSAGASGLLGAWVDLTWDGAEEHRLLGAEVVVRRIGRGTYDAQTTLHDPPARTRSQDREVMRFTTDDPDATFQCRLDGRTWSPCASPHPLIGLTDHPHTFEVRAVSPEGWVEPTQASAAWQTEARAPDTTIVIAPPARTNEDHAIVQAEADEIATFECRHLEEAWEECDVNHPPSLGGRSGWSSQDLAPGLHRVEVRAVDVAGRKDPTPAAATWTVDHSAPDTTITEAPSGTINDPAPVVRFTADDPGATFECAQGVDASDHDFRPCRSGERFASRGGISVRALDAAGNVDPTPATASWTLDDHPPWTSLFRYQADPARPGVARFRAEYESPWDRLECSLDGAPWGACPKADTQHSTAREFSYSGLAPGEHTLRVRAVDQAGNADPTPAAATWSVPAPVARRMADDFEPYAIFWDVPSDPSYTDTARFSFEAEDESGPIPTDCRLDGGAWEACPSPHEISGLAHGPHELWLRGRLADGGTTEPVSHRWTVDLVTPETRVTPGQPIVIARTTATWSLASDRSGATFECRLDLEAWQPCASPYERAGLSEGRHRMQVRAVNGGVRDPTPWRDELVVDLTPPDTAIDSWIRDGMTTSRTGLDFDVDEIGDDDAGAWCRLDGGAWDYFCDPLEDLAPGTHRLEAFARDQAGNMDPTPAVLVWTIGDPGPGGSAPVAPPETVGGDGPPALTRDRAAEFSFSAAPATGAYDCRLDGGRWLPCRPPYRVEGMADGPHRLEVAALGPGGSDPTPAAWTWTVDTVAPVTTIGDRPPATGTATDALIAFAAPGAAGFECRLGGGAWTPCASPVRLSGLSVGDHALRVRARDAAGNVEDPAAEVAWTVVAPRADGGHAGDGASAGGDASAGGGPQPGGGTGPSGGEGGVADDAVRPSWNRRAAARALLRALRTRRPALRWRADRAARVTVALVCERVGGRAARTVVGRAAMRFSAAGERRARIRLTRRGRALLRGARALRVRVRVTVRPAGGRATTWSHRGRVPRR